MLIEEFPGAAICIYTRAQAIEYGVLIDVTTEARRAGFKVSVAISDHLWCQYIEPSDALDGLGQSTKGRLWDVLQLALPAAVEGMSLPAVYFYVLFLMSDDSVVSRKKVKLTMTIGPGDSGEAVITIMLPEDD